MNIEELEENEGVEQQFVKVQAMQKDAREEEMSKARV
jgi:hypothetical protein